MAESAKGEGRACPVTVLGWGLSEIENLFVLQNTSRTCTEAVISAEGRLDFITFIRKVMKKIQLILLILSEKDIHFCAEDKKCDFTITSDRTTS
jgi:hypothetical protein